MAEDWHDLDRNAVFRRKGPKGFDHGTTLVLAALPRHHDGEDRAFVVVDGVENGVGNLSLGGIERLLGDQRGEALDWSHMLVGVHTVSIASFSEKA